MPLLSNATASVTSCPTPWVQGTLDPAMSGELLIIPHCLPFLQQTRGLHGPAEGLSVVMDLGTLKGECHCQRAGRQAGCAGVQVACVCTGVHIDVMWHVCAGVCAGVYMHVCVVWMSVCLCICVSMWVCGCVHLVHMNVQTCFRVHICVCVCMDVFLVVWI